jgi:DNA-binding LytR/AlgR family response regulator
LFCLVLARNLAAIEKQFHFSQSTLLPEVFTMIETVTQRWRRRVLVRYGKEVVIINAAEIALFYTENNVVYLLNKHEKKFICDDTLSELEEQLDPKQFFRISRQYLINVDIIRSFKTYERVRLEVSLNIQTISSVLISQQTTPKFKVWLSSC